MTSTRRPRLISRVLPPIGLVAGLLASTLVAVATPYGALSANAAHPDLTVEIISAPNFVVDSNIESPSSYGPEAAHIAAKVCNTGADTLTDVQVMSGDFDPDGVGGYVDSTPGTYPSKTHAGLTGTFSFIHEGGDADATRFVGQLASGECTTQYYLISYPTLDDLGNSVTGGRTTDDDMSLDFDMWVTATDPVDGAIFEAETATATLRSEISAMANKIWPNTTSKVPNEYLEAFQEQLGWTPDPNTTAGTAAQLQGIWYDLGRVNKGYDANGDFLPDFDLWMQPVGDAGLYDPACTRLVHTYGVVIVKKNDGTEQVIAFEDQLYFSDVAQNNTGAIGLVFYQFATLGGGCTSALTPYQEVASGSNNEKFNGDYGTSAGIFSPSAPAAAFDKASSPAEIAAGGTVTYDLSLTNASATETLGLAAVGLPPVIRETIPAGSTYVLGSASTVTQPTGTTSNTLYYDASIAAWTTTEPAVASNVGGIQWWLDADIPATETFATRLQVTAAPGAGQVIIENTGGGSFGGGAAFLTDTTNTFVTGTNTIGDTVFGDDGGTTGIAGDGVQNGDEAGIDDIGVSLYVDVNGDGMLDAGDLLRATTSSSGGGSYTFPNLPDASYLVVMDDADGDIPGGWGPSAPTTVAVTLAGGDDLTVDFALAPALVIDKNLVGVGPVAEGDQITYTIDVTNQLKVTGEPTTQDLWLTVLDGGSSFSDAGFALNAPDGSDAVGNTPSNDVLIATQPAVADTSAAISAVLLVIDYSLTAPLGDDDVDVIVTKSGTPLTVQNFDVATLNAGTPGELVLDITTLDGVTWTWADLQAATTGLNVKFVKNGGTDGPDFLVDAFGFRVDALPAGGYNEATTLSPVPLTDTYDPTKLDFVSASVAPSMVNETTGSITWNDVGPVNGGDTTQIEVTFNVISSTTLTASYNADNTVSSTTSTFANGNPANSATDIESVIVTPQGTISGTAWGEATGGTTGWVGATGVEVGIDYGLPTVTVDLYACVVTATGVPTAPGTLTTKACGGGGTGTNWAVYATTTTDASGDYRFDGLPNGFYYVDIDESTLPSGQSATAEADAGAGVAGNQNNSGASCGTCDGIWGTPGATENSGLFNTIDTVGEDITNISFGYTTDAAVYGNLWEDVDGDGIKDAGDGALAGWTVTAFDGVTPHIATTDADGNYVVDGLPAGSYTVSVTTPGGQTWTETFETDATVDNSASVTVAAGEINGAWDFAFTETDASTIGDTVYWDWNGNGTQDASDEGVDGVTVDLYRDDNADGVGDVFVRTTTTIDGAYSFTSLPAGDYIVIVDTSGPLLTAGPVGDPDEVGTCTVCDGQSTVTVDGTASDLAQDFGFRPQGAASIGDTIYYDSNGDATQGATEVGLANITVNLLADMDANSTYVVIASAATDASGNYTFDGLPDGNYRVVADSADTDLPDDGVGNLVVPVVSDAVDVTIASGASTDTADIGYAALGSIGDVVFVDANGNGTQDVDEGGWANVNVALWQDTDDNGSYETQVGSAIATDANGTYLFSGLEPGDYEVRVDSADPDLGGAAQTGDPDRDGETCTDETYILLADVPCDNADSGITVTYGTNYYGADFGYQPPGVVGDFVWNDANGDGIQDAGEPGLANVTVEIWRDTDAIPDGIGDILVASTFTDSDGYYSFASIADDNYVIVVDTATLPFTMVATSGPQSAGAASSPTVVAGGSIDLSVDFGFKISGASSLAGTVCLEPSGATNGACDVPANENELADVTVYLYDASNAFLGSTTTGPSGDYLFTAIPDGPYTVSVGTTELPLSISDTTTPTATESAASVYQSATVSGATIDVDFGFVQVVDIDLGDLDAPFDSTLTSGPYHEIGSLFLGAAVDADTATLADADATGDDLDGTDDEDGVTFDSTTWTPDAVADGDDGSVDITVTGGSGFFFGWIDWNGDGAFTGTGELVANLAVTAGATTVSFDIPDGTDLNADFAARFRLFAEAPTLPALAYAGGATNGEIEDYLILGPIMPDTVNDAYSATEDTTLTISTVATGVMDNDDEGNAPTTVTSFDATSSQGGTVAVAADGTFTYTPADDFVGIDTFTYTITDDLGLTDTATVTITVTDGGSPDAVDDTATIAEGTTTSTLIDAIGTGDVLTDDATYLLGSLDTTGTTGTVTDNLDGTFGYIPDPSFSGIDTFTYTICDDDSPASPTSCDTATVTITVTDGGSPDAVDDTATIAEGTTTSTLIDAIGTGDVLTDDATYLLGSLDTTGTTGTVTDNLDGTFGYIPDPSFSGIDTFTYTICDDDSPASPTSCDTATVTITVTDGGSPDAVDDTATIAEGTTTSTLIDAIGTGDVLTDDATYLLGSLDTTGTTGTVTDNLDGTFGYIPDPSFSGIDTFTYTICDDDSPASPTSCDTATVTITVTDGGSPDAVDDTATIAEGTTTSTLIDAIGTGDVLTDDATYLLGSLDTTGTTGTVTDNLDGTFGYIPDPSFSGIDTFTYTICDDDSPASPTSCDTATVTITVTAATSVNNPPVATDDSFTTSEDTTLTGNVLTDGVPDGDVDSDPLLVDTTPITDVSHGTLTLHPDGTFTYVPDTNYSGPDSFEYQICDDGADEIAGTLDDLCDTATVSIDVTADNDPPVATNDSTSTTGDPITIDPSLNDSDIDGDSLTVTSVDTTGTIGSVTITNGNVVYTPLPGFIGDDTFDYTVCDPGGLCDTATVTVTDNNLPPSITPPGGGNVVGQPLPPLSATDPEGDVITFTVVGGSTPPGVTLMPDGTFTGVPAAVGTTTASVEVCDANGACTVSPVVLSINGVGGDLPSTGQHSRKIVVWSLELLALGFVLLLGSRRRRNGHTWST